MDLDRADTEFKITWAFSPNPATYPFSTTESNYMLDNCHVDGDCIRYYIRSDLLSTHMDFLLALKPNPIVVSDPMPSLGGWTVQVGKSLQLEIECFRLPRIHAL